MCAYKNNGESCIVMEEEIKAFYALLILCVWLLVSLYQFNRPWYHVLWNLPRLVAPQTYILSLVENKNGENNILTSTPRGVSFLDPSKEYQSGNQEMWVQLLIFLFICSVDLCGCGSFSSLHSEKLGTDSH